MNEMRPELGASAGGAGSEPKHGAEAPMTGKGGEGLDLRTKFLV